MHGIANCELTQGLVATADIERQEGNSWCPVATQGAWCHKMVLSFSTRPLANIAGSDGPQDHWQSQEPIDPGGTYHKQGLYKGYVREYHRTSRKTMALYGTVPPC